MMSYFNIKTSLLRLRLIYDAEISVQEIIQNNFVLKVYK